MEELKEPEKIRVLIVDDSAIIREMLYSILSSDRRINVVGFAKDGNEAIKNTFALKPDVITMDLNMPRISGLEAIERIMEEIPTPIIVVSSMQLKEIIKALGAGAMDFVPIKSGDQDIAEMSADLIEKIKTASRVRPLRRIKSRPAIIINAPPKREVITKVVAVGVSTGGPQALAVLLSKLPSGIPAGILVVQHMSVGFINGLVEWLQTLSRIDIKVAKNGDILKNSMVLFAPDNYDMIIDSDAKIELKKNTAKQALHVPSIDEMMKSVAHSFGRDAIGLIMTGMGQDGVEGINAIKKAGGMTIAQDQDSSVIYGMNKVAIEKGYIDKVVALEQIVDEILRML